jgi:hypothetical protein
MSSRRASPVRPVYAATRSGRRSRCRRPSSIEHKACIPGEAHVSESVTLVPPLAAVNQPEKYARHVGGRIAASVVPSEAFPLSSRELIL